MVVQQQDRLHEPAAGGAGRAGRRHHRHVGRAAGSECQGHLGDLGRAGRRARHLAGDRLRRALPHRRNTVVSRHTLQKVNLY